MRDPLDPEQHVGGQIDGEKLAAQLSSLLEDIETTRARLKRNMGLAAKIDPDDITSLRSLSTSAVTLSREARAWAKQNKELSARLSLQERIDLMCSFVGKLGLHDRRAFLASIRAQELPWGPPPPDPSL